MYSNTYTNVPPKSRRTVAAIEVVLRLRMRVHVCVRAPYGVCACGGGTLRAGMLMRE